MLLAMTIKKSLYLNHRSDVEAIGVDLTMTALGYAPQVNGGLAHIG